MKSLLKISLFSLVIFLQACVHNIVEETPQYSLVMVISSTPLNIANEMFIAGDSLTVVYPVYRNGPSIACNVLGPQNTTLRFEVMRDSAGRLYTFGTVKNSKAVLLHSFRAPLFPPYNKNNDTIISIDPYFLAMKISDDIPNAYSRSYYRQENVICNYMRKY